MRSSFIFSLLLPGMATFSSTAWEQCLDNSRLRKLQHTRHPFWTSPGLWYAAVLGEPFSLPLSGPIHFLFRDLLRFRVLTQRLNASTGRN